MPGETLEASQPTESKSTDWIKVSLVALGAFALLGLSSYAGYWYGINSAKVKTQSGKTPALEPTPLPTPKENQTVKNTNGSRTFYSYTTNYQITVPEGWGDPDINVNITGEVVFEKGNDSSFDYIIILSEKAPEDTTFEEFLDQHREGNAIPQEPNFEVAGAPAYKYELPSPWESQVLRFEHADIWYEIWIHLTHQNDPEYQSILSTFKFLD